MMFKRDLIKLASFLSCKTAFVVFSLPLLVLFFIRNINSFGDLKKIGGLNKMPLNVIAFIMWLLLLPGTWWYYGHKAGRGDYPWFADSIGIPIMQNTAAIIITFLLLLIILPLLTRQYRSASSVFIRAKLYNAGAMLTEVFYGLFLTISVLALYDCIVNGDHISIIVIMYFIYLFLALRAGRFTYMDNVSH
ncbi:MAG: hypothetical protein EOP47_29905 [Sphingobacteriaceae bacterium]|nr:MAG: hypothetical protein EOP47_29905 [Sphingobacteriaceae bacterium]